ncbi:putative membrane protein [Rubellimicrobium thermophilum DSM 16684]|uniref:Putative membrane protein n=1 Tax=Rubellimicrobium thermophilum DSM 16684 TaxID=1123069 RepID=S9S820_9RHOB|nr:YdcF family protein [Rubellimicrobium thermophilum]EPX86325.1 putative membrane protein [Rubellimicrobium thermophilum DSM 16684]
MRVALILGCAVWPDGPSPALRRRTLHALGLWRRGAVEALVPCGGLGRHPPAEGEAMRSLLLAKGVPDHVIHPETASRSTIENIAFARPILERLGASQILVVTDATHAPRALLVARRFGLDAVASCPPLRSGRLTAAIRQTLREVPATALTLWRLRRMR